MKVLTRWWAEEIYKAKYGVIARWTARDAKLLQGILSNATLNYGTEAQMEIGRGMEAYVNDETPFYANNKHPFSQFASNYVKWMKVKQLPKDIDAQVRYEEKKTPFYFSKLTDEQIEEYVKKAPEAFARGLGSNVGKAIKMNQHVKNNDPTFAKRIADAVVKYLGKDRAREIYLQAQEVVKAI